MKLFKLISLVVLLCLTTQYSEAQIQSNGVFIKSYGGVSVMTANSVDQAMIAADTVSGEAKYRVGWISGLALGYRNNHWAGELAWDYRNNGHKKVCFTDSIKFKGGDYSSRIFFLNGYYYYNAVGGLDLEPYIGAGLGWVEDLNVDLKRDGVKSSFSAGNFLTYQIMVGIRGPLSSHWSLFGEVRYLRIGNVDFEQDNGDAILSNLDYDPFSLMMGISYKF